MYNGNIVNKRLIKRLEEACKDTLVTPRELSLELVTGSYKTLKEIDLSLEDLKAIVSDIEDTKEIAAMYSQGCTTKSVEEASA